MRPRPGAGVGARLPGTVPVPFGPPPVTSSGGRPRPVANRLAGSQERPVDSPPPPPPPKPRTHARKSPGDVPRLGLRPPWCLPRAARPRRRVRRVRCARARHPTATEPSGSGVPPPPPPPTELAASASACGRGGLWAGGRGGACPGAEPSRGGHPRFAASAQAPPLGRHGSAPSLLLYGASQAHSFGAGPAGHLFSDPDAAAARRRSQHVRPHHRHAGRHPDLPVRRRPAGQAHPSRSLAPEPAKAMLASTQAHQDAAFILSGPARLHAPGIRAPEPTLDPFTGLRPRTLYPDPALDPSPGPHPGPTPPPCSLLRDAPRHAAEPGRLADSSHRPLAASQGRRPQF